MKPKVIFVLTLISLSIFTLTLAGTAEAWVLNPATGHYYELTSSPMTWSNAEAEAVSVGGHLVTINDAAEEAWLLSQFGNYPLWNPLWIGFYQPTGSQEPGGGWTWISGETVTYTNWAASEPSNSGDGEAYAAMNWHPLPATWNDLPAAHSIPGIIEVVPLPASVLLLGSGLLGLAGWRWRTRKS